MRIQQRGGQSHICEQRIIEKIKAGQELMRRAEGNNVWHGVIRIKIIRAAGAGLRYVDPLLFIYDFIRM